MSMRDEAWIEYCQSHNIEYPSSASYNAKNNNNNPYIVDISKYDKLDIYRILKLYEVSDPCLQHSIKKLLCAGKRGVKKSNTRCQGSNAITAKIFRNARRR